MNETEQRTKTTEKKNGNKILKAELARLARQMTRWLPGFLGGIIPLALIGTGGLMLGIGALAEMLDDGNFPAVIGIMAGLIFLFFGTFGLVKQAHLLFARLLEGGKK